MCQFDRQLQPELGTKWRINDTLHDDDGHPALAKREIEREADNCNDSSRPLAGVWMVSLSKAAISMATPMHNANKLAGELKLAT